MIETIQNLGSKSNSIVSNLLSTFDELTFFKQLSLHIGQIFPKDKVIIYKIFEETSAQKMAMNGQEVRTHHIDKGFGVAGHVIRTRKAYYSNSLKRDPLYCHSLYDFDANAELCVPIICEQMVLGTVHLQSNEVQRNYSQVDIQKIYGLLLELQKPLINMQIYLSARNLNEILLKKMAEKEQEEKGRLSLQSFIKKDISEIKILGKSQSLLQVIDIVERVAYTDSNVLILGETGTGKEMFGQRIHQLSPRKSKAYLVVNAASLGDFYALNLEKKYCPIREIFREASGGTLFIKNVSELKIEVQLKLLRILQEKDICQKNGNQNHELNVRLLCSSNKDLLKEIEAGNFLEELYLYINSLSLKVPSLLSRDEDVLVLSQYFLNPHAEVGGVDLTPDAMKALMVYHWPGNIRELQNVIQSARILSGGKAIDQTHLPEEIKTQKKDQVAKQYLDVTLASLEKSHICYTLERVLGNKTKAAKALGITVKTLYNKLHSYDMI